jgi:hypothetical protein
VWDFVIAGLKARGSEREFWVDFSSCEVPGSHLRGILKAAGSRIEILDLSNGGVQTKKEGWFASGIKGVKSIMGIDVEKSSDPHYALLADGLAQNRGTIGKLDLTGNKIDDDRCELLAKGITSNLRDHDKDRFIIEIGKEEEVKKWCLKKDIIRRPGEFLERVEEDKETKEKRETKSEEQPNGDGTTRTVQSVRIMKQIRKRTYHTQKERTVFELTPGYKALRDQCDESGGYLSPYHVRSESEPVDTTHRIPGSESEWSDWQDTTWGAWKMQ